MQKFARKQTFIHQCDRAYLHDRLVQSIGDQRRRLSSLRMHMFMQLLDYIRENFGGLLVQIGDGNAGSESGEIRVTGGT